MTTFMFPGQGSQAKGMGGNLFDQFPDEVNQATAILGYSIKTLCLEDPSSLLNNTEYTQPALFVVEALSYLDKIQTTQPPTYYIGHSLGEYSALFAAGVFDFETGLKLVKKRAELMGKAQGGGMLAVVNLTEDRILSLLQSQELTSIDFANYNSPKQVVLSGKAEDIKAANAILSTEALLCVPLKVSGAFHSRYMQDAANTFAAFIDAFHFNPPQGTVIANVNAQPYTLESVKSNLVSQIASPVQWVKTISYLKGLGETEFVEIGPGSVLTRLLAQN